MLYNLVTRAQLFSSIWNLFQRPQAKGKAGKLDEGEKYWEKLYICTSMDVLPHTLHISSFQGLQGRSPIGITLSMETSKMQNNA